jgi:peptide/nickel transport system permease protein
MEDTSGVNITNINRTPSPMATADAKAPDRLMRKGLSLSKRYGIAFWSGLLFALIIAITLAAPLLTSYSPTKIDIPSRLLSPSLSHPFGTDEFGRDLLTRVLYGGRPVLLTGLASVVLGMMIGVTIGTASGYGSRRVDEILMRLMDVMLSFPAILLAILIVAALGSGLVNTVIAIAFSMIPVFARLGRSIVMVLVLEQYVLASRAIGAADIWIILKHILPNLIPPIIVQATAMLAIAISYSAALSFIGLGIEPPTPDWGLMVSEGQRLIFDAPHVPFFPGLAITITILCVNYLGDGLRDHLDPTMKNR